MPLKPQGRIFNDITETIGGTPLVRINRLIPPGQATAQSGGSSALIALAKAGRLTLGAENDASVYPKLSRLLKHRRAAELLDEERGGR